MTMTTIQIKHRYSGAVLYECEAPEGMESGLKMRHALEKAVANGANLSYADLSYADLRGASLRCVNLGGANLRHSDLSYADLSYADLSYADLSYADLSYADLSYADLRSADLRSANLDEGKKLVGARPVLTVGPIGSRNDCTTAYLTESGVYVRAGCFFDTLDQFEIAVEKKHGSNKHGCEYIAAVALIKAHAEIWTPKEEAQP